LSSIVYTFTGGAYLIDAAWLLLEGSGDYLEVGCLHTYHHTAGGDDHLIGCYLEVIVTVQQEPIQGQRPRAYPVYWKAVFVHTTSPQNVRCTFEAVVSFK
jgi:hypothetical protein